MRKTSKYLKSVCKNCGKPLELKRYKTETMWIHSDTNVSFCKAFNVETGRMDYYKAYPDESRISNG